MTPTADMTVQVPLLETQRLRFRAPAVSDFDAECAYYASERSRGVGGPYTPDQVWKALMTKIGQWIARGYGIWALDEKETGAYVGRVGINHPADWPEPEIAWTVMADGEGKGYAFEAAHAARAYAYAAYGWTTLTSMIVQDNPRSQALARRLGCVQEDDFQHPSYGALQVWRHPAPEALA